MNPRPTRRAVLSATGATLVAALAGRAAAKEPILLEWSDLIPPEARGEGEVMTRLGILQHGELPEEDPEDAAERGAMVTTEYNGRRVSLPGFLIPLDMTGLGATSFILVPYVGACIHVPPPPPNQLVYVTTEEPYAITELFEPVEVTGAFETNTVETDLADIGYALAAERIEPFEM